MHLIGFITRTFNSRRSGAFSFGIVSRVSARQLVTGNRFHCFPKRPDLRSGPPSPLYNWVPRVPSAEVKRPRREADHPPPSCTEVKNEWSCTITSPYPFMVCKGRTLHFYRLVVRRRTPSITLPYRVDCPRHNYVYVRQLPLYTYKRAGAQQMYRTESLHPPGRSATVVLRRTVEGNIVHCVCHQSNLQLTR